MIRRVTRVSNESAGRIEEVVVPDANVVVINGMEAEENDEEAVVFVVDVVFVGDDVALLLARVEGMDSMDGSVGGGGSGSKRKRIMLQQLIVMTRSAAIQMTARTRIAFMPVGLCKVGSAVMPSDTVRWSFQADVSPHRGSA